MVFVLFSGTSSQGEYQTCSYGGPTIESCLLTLDMLVASGWQLHEAHLSEEAGKQMILPIEVFDGEMVSTHFEQLQRTWESILKRPTYYLRVIALNKYINTTIDQAKKSQERVSQQREERKRRIENLFEKMDAIQARIQETKDKWGVI